MKIPFALAPVLVLASCIKYFEADPVTLQKYDAISACADESAKNPLRANCGETHKDTELTGELGAINVTAGGPMLIVRIREASNIFCTITEPQGQEKLAALDPGDLVTIKGTPAQRITVGRQETISLRPCVLLSSKKPPKEAPAKKDDDRRGRRR